MKKKYTKKQIQEAINYWTKQLKLGNYKKLNESYEYDNLKDSLENELISRNDIPNYIKAYIHDIILDNAGYDDMGYDFEIDPIVNSLKRERVITLYAADRINNIQNINIPTNTLPLKVTANQILRQANISKQLTPLYIELKFDNEVGTFVIGLENNFNDQDWCERILNSKKFPIELGSDGDATMLYNRRCGGDYTIDSAGRVQRG